MTSALSINHLTAPLGHDVLEDRDWLLLSSVGLALSTVSAAAQVLSKC